MCFWVHSVRFSVWKKIYHCTIKGQATYLKGMVKILWQKLYEQVVQCSFQFLLYPLNLFYDSKEISLFSIAWQRREHSCQACRSFCTICRCLHPCQMCVCVWYKLHELNTFIQHHALSTMISASQHSQKQRI